MRYTLIGATAFLVVILVIGCASDGVKTAKTDSPDVKVTLLFEHEGCRVYRFFDAGEYIYYANCGGSFSTAWDMPRGKTIHHERVSTYEK